MSTPPQAQGSSSSPPPVPIVAPGAASAVGAGGASATAPTAGGSPTAVPPRTPPAPLLYRDRPEWADVTPLEQYEGMDPLAPIFYSEEYRDATDYFRGIVKIGEKSERVLDLTETIMRLNSAHYSAWQYRYDTLIAINAPLDKELKLMNELCVKYLKTYQVWHHRRLLLTAIRPLAPTSAPTTTSGSSPSLYTTPPSTTPPPSSPPPSSPTAKSKHDISFSPQTELEFISRVLQLDTKNYHTWSYRQWVLSYFDEAELWRWEMDYVDDMLAEDVRNNSVWHHRFFVIWQGGRGVEGVGPGVGVGVGVSVGVKGEEERERVVRRELIYTKQKIALAPNNPSAWNYLRGVLDHTQTPYKTLLPFVVLYAVQPGSAPAPPAGSSVEGEDAVVDIENPAPSEGAELPCTAALEFLADVYEKACVSVLEGAVETVEGESATVEGTGKGRKEIAKEQIDKAVEIWQSLGGRYDTIRKNYWNFRIKTARQRLAATAL